MKESNLKNGLRRLKLWLPLFLLLAMTPRLWGQNSSAPNPLTAEERTLLYGALSEVKARLAQLPPDSVVRRGGDVRNDFEERLLITSYGSFIFRLRQNMRSLRAVWWEANRQFLAVIDYDRLFKNLSFLLSLSRFERIRKDLDSKDPFGACGRRFLLEMAEQFFKLYPPTDTLMLAKIRIAKAYLIIKEGAGNKYLPKENLPKPVADLYNNIGRFLLLQCAIYLQNKVDRAPDFAKSPVYQSYKSALEQGGVYLNNEISDLSKTWRYVKSGEVGYIWNRFLDEAESRLTTREQKTKNVSNSQLALNRRSSWNLDTIVLYDIFVDGEPIGNFLFIKDIGRVNFAGYEAHESKGYSLDELRSKHGAREIYAACTGNYSTEVHRSIGFSAVQGKIPNYFVDHKMDGLVYITPDKMLHVKNLAEGLEIDDHVLIYPQKYLPDVAALWEWVERQRISCFQTHILINDGKPVINPQTSPYELRERRVLAVFPDHTIGIINFPGKHDLVEVTCIVQKLFASGAGQFWPLSLVNLDVGRYDVYRVVDDYGTTRIAGAKDFSVAPNLLFVYK